MAYSWTCPTCGHHATIGEADSDSGELELCTTTGFPREGFVVEAGLVKCPNAACGKSVLKVWAYWGKPYKKQYGRGVERMLECPAGIGEFTFLPTVVKPLSGEVPQAVQDDYREAFLIRSLSPKASATLARRALQGMIRGYWAISLPTLAAELRAIQDRCDPGLYEAMMGLKSIGNIGAHPEKDISSIIDIDSGEAEQLLELIHLLDKEWYVARANRLRSIEAVAALATAKKQQAE